MHGRMTREHKLSMVVGFGLILFVGILLSDHLRRGSTEDASLPSAAASALWSMPDTLAPRSPARLTDPGPRTSAAPPRTQVPSPADSPRVLILEPSGSEPHLITPAVVPVPVPRAPSAGIHVLQPGDTLQSVSQQHFGTTRRWPEIARLNNITNADRIREGQRLRLPGEETTRPAPKQARATTYTVKKGDTLSGIASKALGSKRRWRDIQTINNIQDPTTIAIGDVLTLPSN